MSSALCTVPAQGRLGFSRRWACEMATRATPESMSLSTSPYSPTGLPCTVATVGTARRPATSGPIVVWSWITSKSAGADQPIHPGQVGQLGQ